MDAPIVIKQKKGRTFLYSVGALAFSLLSLLFVFIDFGNLASSSSSRHRGILALMQNPVGGILLKLVFVVGFLFFGYCFLFLIKKMRSTEDILVVDDRGVTDNSSALSFGFIPWEDIEDVCMGGVLNNLFIELVLRDEGRYVRRLGGIRRTMVLANRKMGHQAMCITLNGTGVPPADVFPKVRERFLSIKREVRRDRSL